MKTKVLEEELKYYKEENSKLEAENKELRDSLAIIARAIKDREKPTYTV
mgnify:CR=1 FL=1|tara:strand:+ start:534 stop:680 length:147 start_codon:yes stop_codon:yes gene_type:complete